VDVTVKPEKHQKIKIFKGLLQLNLKVGRGLREAL
jgi:hypothetical protein